MQRVDLRWVATQFSEYGIRMFTQRGDRVHAGLVRIIRGRRQEGGAKLVKALTAEMDRLANTSEGPDTLSAELRAEIAQHIENIDKLLTPIRPGHHRLNVGASLEFRNIRRAFSAVLE